MKKINHELTDEMICPCCYESIDSEGCWDEGDGICPRCGNVFWYEEIVKVLYTTSKID